MTLIRRRDPERRMARFYAVGMKAGPVPVRQGFPHLWDLPPEVEGALQPPRAA